MTDHWFRYKLSLPFTEWNWYLTGMGWKVWTWRMSR